MLPAAALIDPGRTGVFWGNSFADSCWRQSMSRKKKKIFKKILAIPAVLLAAALAFLGLFYITDVEVVGNTRYTKDQISEMALQGPLSYNSILMSAFRKTIRPEAAFVDVIHVSFRDRNTVRLEVQEKYPIGYLEIDGTDYYFDKDGLVLEAIAGTSVGAEADNAAEKTEKSTAAEEEKKASSEEETEDITKAARNSSDTTFRPALTDVPLITGLKASNVQTGQTIETDDPSVFQVILSLTKLIDKFSIQPDQVAFSKTGEMTLYYDQVRIQLGKDTYLEEKVSRVAAILPELEGMSGVLHLEEYTKDTQNIIFDRDKTEEKTEKSEETE